MLYYSFRSAVERLKISCQEIFQCCIPGGWDEVPDEISNALDSLREIIDVLSHLTDMLPAELDGHEDKRFGPLMEAEDLHKVISLVFPFAEWFDENCPMRSYNLMGLYRGKVCLLVEVINLYYEWKQYILTYGDLSGYETISLLANELNNINLISTEELKLSTLFNNINNSSYLVQKDIESDISIQYQNI